MEFDILFGEPYEKKEIRSSGIREIALNPLYITNKEFELLKIQGFKV